MKYKVTSKTKKKVQTLFLKNNGYLKASEALFEGIHPRDLYALRDSGDITLIIRGLFRLTSMPELRVPELFIIAVKIPHGVLCLQSALAFHHLVEPFPKEISVALVKGSEKPVLRDFLLKTYLVSEPAFSEGIQIHQGEGVSLRVYSLEKTLADCFKFRTKVGMDFCLAALQKWWKREDRDLKQFLAFCRICRVEKIVRPYLDLLISQTYSGQKK